MNVNGQQRSIYFTAEDEQTGVKKLNFQPAATWVLRKESTWWVYVVRLRTNTTLFRNGQETDELAVNSN